MQAKAMLKDYYVGDLVDSPAPSTTSGMVTVASTVSTATVASAASSASLTSAASSDGGSASSTPAPAPVALNPREKVKLRMTERIEVSHNTRIFRFALPSPEHRLGLPTGRHLFVYAATKAGETVARAYTPISCESLCLCVLKVGRAGKVFWASSALKCLCEHLACHSP